MRADLAWVAGFLEGEGSFSGSPTGITVSASQVQLEPLVRVQRLLGGKIAQYSQRNPNSSPYHRWTIHGSYAVGVAFTLYTWLSPRRRAQVQKLVAVWKACPGRNQSLITHCPRGHEYTPENTYRYGTRRKRLCRRCVFTVYPATRRAKEA